MLSEENESVLEESRRNYDSEDANHARQASKLTYWHQWQLQSVPQRQPHKQPPIVSQRLGMRQRLRHQGVFKHLYILRRSRENALKFQVLENKSQHTGFGINHESRGRKNPASEGTNARQLGFPEDVWAILTMQVTTRREE
ncbi:hypothetical protein FPCIR_5671 [Fusarium pseudocircinatum]|uniref:Uncharacterized protein n=1 Tax=Fusarium pseudocircinatum TaxID=56676 RepID=A0A8H5P935_9HYPO|nr:hypothetical protein FPCIR_5671 [Fusarium pseudocircinatum]